MQLRVCSGGCIVLLYHYITVLQRGDLSLGVFPQAAHGSSLVLESTPYSSAGPSFLEGGCGRPVLFFFNASRRITPLPVSIGSITAPGACREGLGPGAGSPPTAQGTSP